MKTNYRNSYCVMACVAILIAQGGLLATFAADENQGRFSSSDFKFVKAAASGGTMEVNLGNLALTKSTNAAVQHFGQHMAADHGRAGDELGRIVLSKGASLPSEPMPEQQKEIDRLNKLSGADFDTAYVAFMVKAHKADEKAFKEASEKSDDPDLKAFAAKTLTMVQDHLKMAEELDGNLKHGLSMNQ